MSRRTSSLIAAAAITLLVPATVLAQSPDASTMPAASPIPGSSLSVEGMPWHLRLYRAEDGEMAGAYDGGWIKLQDGVLTGSTGCNDLSGRYALEGSTLTFTDISPTEASCLDGDIVAQEMAVLARLPQVVGYALEPARGRDGIDLVFIDAADGRHLAFQSIQGRTWTPVYDGSEPMPEGYVTIRFENGTAFGQGPCDAFTGPFTQADLTVAIGPFETGRNECPDLELQGELLAGLELARSYMFQSADLVLLDEQGGPIRTYTAVTTGD
jgi:heat shock protein HslJ